MVINITVSNSPASQRSSVRLGALVEMALVCAIPYLAIVASVHGEGLRQVQVEQGHDALVTFVASLIFWPVLLFAHSCAT